MFSPNISPLRAIQMAFYVARKVRRAGHADQAEAIVQAARELQSHTRTLEDLQLIVYTSIADRDMADDDLDAASQGLRLGLAGRSLTATAEAPYTLILQKGIKYYTAAPLTEQEARYRELAARVERYLEADDPLRAPTLAAIEAGLTAWIEASQALGQARRHASLGRSDVEAAQEALGLLLERTFGLLVQDFGRKRARRFFPKVERAALKKAEADDDETLPTDPE